MKSVRYVAVAGMLVLAGCGDNGSARQVLGLDRKAPDAFAVSTHAPLAVPGNLNSQLPPPQPGAPRPQDVTAQSMAQQAVLSSGASTAVSTTASAGEQALLQQAGPADRNVRLEVNREAAEDADTQSGPLDWLVFWRDKPQPGVAVDAKAEAERLARNRQSGQPATEGATPVIEDSGRLSVPKEIQ